MYREVQNLLIQISEYIHTLIQEIQLVADRTRVHLMNPSPAPAPPSF